MIDPPTDFDRLDLADRLRADLAGLVRLGAGRHLAGELAPSTYQAAAGS